MKINLNKIKTYSIKKRFSKVDESAFAKICSSKKAGFGDFLRSLPGVLKARDFQAVVESIVAARKKKKPVILMMGAHVIKCGLSPLVIDLIKKKVITAVAVNGAGLIHDFEIAYQAKTSEDVGPALKDGKFGMGRETPEFINAAIKDGVKIGLGAGLSVGKAISDAGLKYKQYSIARSCYVGKIPLTAHVAIGTDIIHQHPSFDGASTGEASQRDFILLAETVANLGNGGVVLNFGSAVLLPEVFLKALNLARNLKGKIENFTCANFDMIHHYRPFVNVVSRPTQDSGKGYYIIGHHEIMFPLLYRAIIEKIS